MTGVGYKPPSSAPPKQGREEFAAPAGAESDEESERQKQRDTYVSENFSQLPLVEELPIPVVTLRDSQLRQCAYVPANVKYQGYCDDYESGMACVYQVSLCVCV